MSDSVIPWTVAHQGPLSMGIVQARILEWAAMASSGGSSQSRDWTWGSYVCCTGSRLFTTSASWEALLCVSVTLLCPTLCNPMACGLLGSSVHGILQPRILEWIAMPFSRGSFWPRDRTQVCYTAGGFFTRWAPGEGHWLLCVPPVLSAATCVSLRCVHLREKKLIAL